MSAHESYNAYGHEEPPEKTGIAREAALHAWYLGDHLPFQQYCEGYDINPYDPTLLEYWNAVSCFFTHSTRKHYQSTLPNDLSLLLALYVASPRAIYSASLLDVQAPINPKPTTTSQQNGYCICLDA